MLVALVTVSADCSDDTYRVVAGWTEVIKAFLYFYHVLSYLSLEDRMILYRFCIQKNK